MKILAIIQVEMDEEERAMVAEGAATRPAAAGAATSQPPAAAGGAEAAPRPTDGDDDDDMRIVRDYKRPDARCAFRQKIIKKTSCWDAWLDFHLFRGSSKLPQTFLQ